MVLFHRRLFCLICAPGICTALLFLAALQPAPAQSLLVNSPEPDLLTWPVIFLLTALAIAMAFIARDYVKLRQAAEEAETREKAMRNLAESERRYRFIIDHAADVIWQLDRELRITYLSDAIWGVAGYAPKEMIGTPLAEILVGESYHELLQRLALLDQHPVPPDADPFKIDLELIRRDRSALWVEVHITALRALQGGVVGYFGVTRDISERRHAEQALRNSEEKFRTLLEGAPFAITVLRWEDALILYTNQQAAEELATRIDQIIGRNCWDFFDDQASIDDIGRELQEHGYINDLQVRLKRDNGEVFWAIFSARVVAFEGTVAAFFAFSDISVTKRAESDLLGANDLLKQKLEEIETLQSRLREQAVRDGLTGLFNRRYLDETLEREVARAKRERGTLALVMVDVDHFKRINDTHGHQAGDEVLKTLSRLLSQNTRVEDIVCRYGGEEFIVMMPKASAEIARIRAEHWRKAFEETAASVGRKRVRATISLGVASYPASAADATQLLRLVDEALYEAKRAGRNRVVANTPAAVEPSQPELEIRSTGTE